VPKCVTESINGQSKEKAVWSNFQGGAACAKKLHLLAPLAPNADYQPVILHRSLHHFLHPCWKSELHKYTVSQVAVQEKIRTPF